MTQNLIERGCPLQSIFKYPDLISQQSRFTSLGWQHVQVKSMLSIYNNIINSKEGQR